MPPPQTNAAAKQALGARTKQACRTRANVTPHAATQHPDFASTTLYPSPHALIPRHSTKPSQSHLLEATHPASAITGPAPRSQHKQSPAQDLVELPHTHQTPATSTGQRSAPAAAWSHTPCPQATTLMHVGITRDTASEHGTPASPEARRYHVGLLRRASVCAFETVLHRSEEHITVGRRGGTHSLVSQPYHHIKTSLPFNLNATHGERDYAQKAGQIGPAWR